MKLHKAIKKANDEKDIEALMPLYHEDVVVDPWMHPV
jgi:ketosteroid isomerase-like protein